MLFIEFVFGNFVGFELKLIETKLFSIMKKKNYILFFLLIFSSIQSFAWTTVLYNRGTPWQTYYLGDYQNHIFYFAVNEDTYQMTVTYGIGQSTNGTGWTWRNAEYHQLNSTYREWKSKANEHQFTAIGNWYYSGRFVWNNGGYTEYASDDYYGSRTILMATSYFTVNALSNPTSLSATQHSSSQINLSWELWNSKNVMIVRKKSTESWTEPTQGYEYTVGNAIGTGEVVFIGSGTSLNNTGLTSSTGYDYKFYSVNNNYYSAGAVVSATTATATTDRFRSKVDGNWTDVGTWESSYDNSAWVNATITPTSTATNVVINHIVAISTHETAGALTINALKSLTINAGKSLTVNGTLTNEAGSSGLVIKSDATGTGSLITANGVAATVERYLTNYSSSSDQKYHFISSPVTEQAIQPNFVTDPPTTGVDFYKFDEPTNYWINTKASGGAWNGDFGNNFEVGRGYMVAYPTSPVTKNFTGTLNAGTYTTGTNMPALTNTPTKGNGWNLIGNPFPSAIDWDAVAKGDGMDNALYYYDASEGNYRYYIQLGSVGSLGSGSRYIPAMQGFMVHAKSTGAKTLTIDNSDRVHQAQNVFYKTAATIPGSLSLKVTADGYEDVAFIHFNNAATAQFDGDYDAYKLKSYSVNVPMVYTKASDGSELAINGLPELSETTNIPVYLEYKTAGTYTFTADLSGISGTLVFLNDLKENTSVNLTQNPVYQFTVAEGDAAERFSLTFGSVGIEDPEQVPAALVYAVDKTIFIVGAEKDAQLILTDISGKMLKQVTTSGESRVSINAASLPKGVYIVTVQGEGARVSRKVVL